MMASEASGLRLGFCSCNSSLNRNFGTVGKFVVNSEVSSE